MISRTALSPVCLVALLLCLHSPAFSADLLEKCPCGPDALKGPIRLLFIQGHRGADFRDSCRQHDLCYDTLGASKERCDDEFLANMLAASEDSKRPKAARRKARLLYWFVSKLGQGAFDSAQELARNNVAISK
tara:strand:- start:796 stop:1194 length:399 start_codon:yes stop_codon:yes gene_type:complete